MPRVARSHSHIPGAVVHVIVRFVDGRFVIDDEARQHYLRLLAAALRSVDWRLISFAMMSSHIHLGLLMGYMALDAWAKSLHIRFAHWLNRRSRRDNPKTLGHVIADRPTTKPLAVGGARLLVSYHHRNPIEAGVVEDAACSDWTSHRAYLGLAQPRGGLDVSLGLRLCGFDDSQRGRQELHAFVQQSSASDYAGLFHGPTEDVAEPVSRTAAISAPDLIASASEVLGVPLEQVMSRARSRGVVRVRRAAILVWLEMGGCAREIAEALRVSPSAVSRLLSRRHDEAEARADADVVVRGLGQKVEFVNLASPAGRCLGWSIGEQVELSI